ncbi:DUF503 domain-containing protein [Tissierella creatinophila]|uniref:YlxP-like protein n=1 Tax=Tissierella creatinophila DSM 6911 TaxID=1123403 RepID=A0A1U7M9E3_TISCR|nr:DUF503 domain-containing protein [Tissierella creatinophila]OLS03860.1 hypothetical protein TICRE_01860 [Tissierella creatinophila DSM 6911]
MIIGVCTVKIRIFEANSLKEKRQVIKSLMGRLKSRFNISIAEVGLNDSWQTSEIGFSLTTNDSNHAREVISKVINFIDGDNRVEILEQNTELL